MARKIITIDLNKWTTQADKAKSEGVGVNVIAMRIARTKAREHKGKKPKNSLTIEYREIPELGITLVAR